MASTTTSLTSDQVDELLLSARYGDLEDLQTTLAPFLSASGANNTQLLSTIKNEDANTLLHYASANGHLDVVNYLLPYTDLDLLLAQNVSGNTPLHWAGLNGHLETVKALVAHIEKLEKENPEQAKKLNLIFHPKSNPAALSQPVADKRNDNNHDHSNEESDGSERKLWDVRNNAGRGPMSEAQMSEQEAVVKYLLERMIDGPESSTLQPAEVLSPKPSTQSVELQTASLNLNN